jgi:hypothetical protein
LDLPSNRSGGATYSTQQIPLTHRENLSQEVLHVTKDKALLCLGEWQQKVKASDNWVAPAGMIVSLFLPLVSAEFKAAFGVAKEMWQALNLVGVMVSFVWLVSSLYRRWRNKLESPKEIVEKLMTQSF